MHYKNHSAFTMLELVFVIVIMGILGKFGVGFLAGAYSNFIYSKVDNSLQAQSEMAVESIATRLQFRIKDSIIARKNNGDFKSLSSSTYASDATVLEWVGSDIDGLRGVDSPLWSGIIDLSLSSASTLKTPKTDTTALNNLIETLSHNSGTGIDNSAIYFIGSDSDINAYGWDGVALSEHNSSVMHPIMRGDNLDEFNSSIAGVDFSGTDIYEYYQLSWSAYAVKYNGTKLTLYYDYQPWEGESYLDGQSALLMENVSTFRFKAVGSVVKIQVCVKSDIINGDAGGDYSLCKEKTIY